MSVIRPFKMTDLLHFNNVNHDYWTATFHNSYYASYLVQWPDFCMTVEGNFDQDVKGYMIAKHEPPPPNPQHHGHLTALSITNPYRGLGLARIFMDLLEGMCRQGKDAVDAWFVDLFVRCNNTRAVEMYEKMGYSVYRRVVDYYGDGTPNSRMSRDELDGFDMRKSMPRDSAKKHVRSNGKDILVNPDQVWA